MSAWKRFLEPKLRPVYQTAMRQLRGLTMGVRAQVFDERGRILLIEHSYTPGWHMPGGGIERGETAARAVARELEEEAGIRPDGHPQLVSIHSNAGAFRGDHVLVYRVPEWSAVAATSRGEILRVDWFDLAALPEGTTPGTRRRITEVLDGGPPDLFW
jgi:8-oxo-dGTP pyrophosphatase MutT (NUDIX family)